MKFFLLLICLTLQTNDVHDIIIEIINDDDTLLNDVNLVQIDNNLCLISVGTAVIDNIKSDQAKVDAITIATLKAQSAINKFINSSLITIEEKLTKKTTYIKSEGSKKVLNTKKLKSLIKERSKGKLINIREIKKWKQGNIQFVALAIII